MEQKNKSDNQIVSLFPYQIKKISNFHFRDHPKALHPDSPKFKQYWSNFLRSCIEGKWVNDEGTWVYLMPKLFFYGNYTKIADKKRNDRFPDIRDNEWIIFTYYMCVEGFSGFEKDEEYTCHDLVRQFEKDPLSLDEVELNSIPDSAKRPGGGLKRYIDPWYYLTRHYLLDKPCKEPLGHALYENRRYNAMVLSARGVGKSYTTFVGCFLHELVTGGVKRFNEIKDINKRLLFGMGARNVGQLQRSINNAKSAYMSMPGQFRFKDKDKQKYMGPFYKRLQGSWEVGKELNHIVKEKSGTTDTQGSSIQMVALTPDRTKIGAGDRFRYVMVEEVGFVDNLLDIHASNKDSLKSEDEPVGSAFYLGTGGDLQAIKQPKAMFEDPSSYDIFGIPNYWKNINKKIGLFIPKTYAIAKYKDPEGNTKLDLAYDFILKQRKKDKEDKDSLSVEIDIMFNPLEPDEMLRPGNASNLPKQDAQDQINRIEAYDLFRKKAQIGKLVFNPLEPSGVEWVKDLRGALKPVISLKIDDETTYTGKDGAIIIYEQPYQYIPKYLYYIVYDPAAKSGDGESFHSVLVYKHFFSGTDNSIEDNIVAEWIGRKETLEENFMEVIKLAKYFNATIFPEINVAGFVDFCIKNNYAGLLEGDAYHLEMEIHGKSSIQRSYYKVGVQMNDRKKNWALKKLRDWLLAPQQPDPQTGVPAFRTIERIYSLRILNEIVAFTNNKHENFDHISSLLILMVLLGKLDGSPPVELIDEDTPKHKSQLVPVINYSTGEDYSARSKRRSRILNY